LTNNALQSDFTAMEDMLSKKFRQTTALRLNAACMILKNTFYKK